MIAALIILILLTVLVASDPDSKVIRAYDAKLAFLPGVADRISYVIDRTGRIAYTYGSMSPEGHVANTLKAVEQLAAGKPPDRAVKR